MRRMVAVLGSNGLLGQDLVQFLGGKFDVTPINRDTYDKNKGKSFDILINANGNSKRFWALNNVYEDFEASTVSVYKSLYDFYFNKYVYISSVDVYANPSDLDLTSEDTLITASLLNSYGFHKYLSEQIVQNNLKNYLILRPSMILGRDLKKGPFYDLLNNNPLLVTQDSKLQLITTLAISQIIDILVSDTYQNKIFNIGGKGTFDFEDVSKSFNISPEWSSEARKQHYEMNVSKIESIYDLKTSVDYLENWLNEQE